MKTKAFELRDKATFIPVIATRLEPECERERYLLARAGYGKGSVMMTLLSDGRSQNNAYDWVSSRTMHVAHLHLETHFEELENGAVIDVEFILGEKPAPKKSEQEE